MKKTFETQGEINFIAVEKPSRSWGTVLHGFWQGRRFTRVVGCGACKKTALIEQVLEMLGHYQSLSGYSSQTLPKVSINLEYDDKHATSWIIKKVGEKC